MIDLRLALRALAGIVTFAVIGAVAWFGYQAWTSHQRQAQTHANVAAVSGSIKAGTAAGHDAVQIVQQQDASEAAIRAQAADDRAAITHAKGAEAPISRDLYYAALRAHCGRSSSKGDPACESVRHPGS